MKVAEEWRFHQSWLRTFLLLGIGLTGGCASPGPPKAPSLNLPAVVLDLTAERVGDEVRLQWTTPRDTTDGLDVQGTMTAEACRAESKSSKAPDPVCLPVRRQAVRAGASEIVDTLPASLLSPDVSLMVGYKVTIRNSRQRTAGASAMVFAAAGSAPSAVQGLRLRGSAQGAVAEWEPKAGSFTVELTRTSDSGKAVVAAKTTRRVDGGKQPLGQAGAPEAVRFRVSAPPGNAGGMIDTTAHRGTTYRYTAQRLEMVMRDGQTLEIRSAPSAVVALTMGSSFAPAAPSGLESIVSLTPQGAVTIDLSWHANTEADLRGYNVYRQEVDSKGKPLGGPARLTPVPVAEPGFHDEVALAARRYSYTVTAISASGEESSPSAATVEEVRVP